MKPVARKRTIAQVVARPQKRIAGLCLGLLLAPVAVLLASTAAPAQVTPAGGVGGSLPAKNYMNKSPFYLPVIIDDGVRAKLREILLYVKDDPSKPWTFAS